MSNIQVFHMTLHLERKDLFSERSVPTQGLFFNAIYVKWFHSSPVQRDFKNTFKMFYNLKIKWEVGCSTDITCFDSSME
jgi:hypothetical protein